MSTVGMGTMGTMGTDRVATRVATSKPASLTLIEGASSCVAFPARRTDHLPAPTIRTLNRAGSGCVLLPSKPSDLQPL